MASPVVHEVQEASLAISCAGLTKDFGEGHGLFDLDLQVRRGEVFGFIGANGAGKTTTIRLLMDLIRPDRGLGDGSGTRYAARQSRGQAACGVSAR